MATDPRDLCTVADVKTSFEPAISSTARDTLIQTLITPASVEMMKYAERQFAPATASATNRFTIDLDQNPDGGWIADLAPYDIRTVTSVTLHPEATSPTTVTAADYALEPIGNFDGVYYKLRLSPYLSMISAFSMRFGEAQVDITGAWGFAAVPVDVKRLCVLTVKAWMRQNPAAYAFPDMQPMEQVQPESPATFMLPGAVLAGLSHYKRAAV